MQIKSSSNVNSMPYTISVVLLYIGFVLLLNLLFVYLPFSSIYGHQFSYAELVVGGIYVFRDLAQRAIGHKVVFAMILAAGISYFLASEQLALASFTAFAIGELVDWLVYSYTRKPLSQRILLSASLSSPVDSAIFLAMLGRLTLLEFVLMSTFKILGAVIVWGLHTLSRSKTPVAAQTL